MSQCEVIRSILFSDIQNRPSYAFSALWVDNRSPSVNDALKFTRVILNDHDVYHPNTGEFKAPAMELMLLQQTPRRIHIPNLGFLQLI